MGLYRPSEGALLMRSPISAGAAGAALFLIALIPGCGETSPAAEGPSVGFRGVFASASDCASFGSDVLKACSAAIERAVKAHEAASPAYRDIEACEKVAGEGRCERSASGTYRARLAAFMVTANGASARAEPLYPVGDGAVGFRTASNTKLLASDRSLAFSRLALSLAETQAAEGKKRGARKKIF